MSIRVWNLSSGQIGVLSFHLATPLDTKAHSTSCGWTVGGENIPTVVHHSFRYGVNFRLPM
jgi:hypothetical protein